MSRGVADMGCVKSELAGRVGVHCAQFSWARWHVQKNRKVRRRPKLEVEMCVLLNRLLHLEENNLLAISTDFRPHSCSAYLNNQGMAESHSAPSKGNGQAS